MSTFNIGAVLAVLPAAAMDLEANAPLDPAPEMSLADMVAALTAAEGDMAKLAVLLQTHPGAVRALDRILAAVEAQGVTWAGTARKFLAALPGGLAAALKYAPDVTMAINMFAPAPTWQPGPRVER